MGLKTYIYSALSYTHLWLRCSNFFNPSQKNYFNYVANKKIGKANDLSAPLHTAFAAYSLTGRSKTLRAVHMTSLFMAPVVH
jgi:hypothetical protein